MEGFFQVEATSPQVILKIIPEEGREGPQIGTWVRQHLSDHFPLEDLSQKLLGLCELKAEGIFPSVSDTAGRLLGLLARFSLDPNHLQEHLLQSGLFFEHRLQRLIETHMEDQGNQLVEEDLKALVKKLECQMTSLSLLGNHQGKNHQTMDELMGGLDQLLNKIEEYQTLNLNPSNPQERIFLLLPLWVENHFQFVEMSLSLPQSDKENSSSEEISILFLLHMPGWGRMTVEVRMTGKGLSCRFHLSDPEIGDFLRSAFPTLNSRLEQKGFHSQLSISIESLENIVQALLGESLIGEESLLNVIV
jgi:hypothetical protein